MITTNFERGIYKTSFFQGLWQNLMGNFSVPFWLVSPFSLAAFIVITELKLCVISSDSTKISSFSPLQIAVWSSTWSGRHLGSRQFPTSRIFKDVDNRVWGNLSGPFHSHAAFCLPVTATAYMEEQNSKKNGSANKHIAANSRSAQCSQAFLHPLSQSSSGTRKKHGKIVHAWVRLW